MKVVLRNTVIISLFWVTSLFRGALPESISAEDSYTKDIYDAGFYRIAYHLYQMEIARSHFGENTDINLMGGANCLEALGSSEQAMREYQLLTSRHPESPLDGKASLKMALCSLNLADNKVANFWAQRALTRAVEKQDIDDATFLKAELDFMLAINDYGLEGFANLAHRLPRGLERQFSAYSTGWLYLKTDDYSLARLYLMQAAQGDDPRLIALAAAGLERARRHLGEWEEAVESANLIGESYPQLEAFSLYRQGLLLLKMGKKAEAATALEQAATHPEGSIPVDNALFLAAQARNDVSDENQALVDLTNLLENHPHSHLNQLAEWQTGVLFFETKKYSSALIHFSNLSNQNTNDPITIESIYYKGLCLRRLHRAWQAREEFTKAAELLPTDDPCGEAAFYMKGEMAFEAANYETALSDYSNYLNQISCKRYRDLATIDMGESYLKLGKNREALALLTDFPNTFPSSSAVPRSILLVGQALQNLNKPSEAEAVFQTLIDKYPYSHSSAFARLLLGDIYYQQGNYAASREVFASFLNIFTKSENADHAVYGICRNDYALKRFEDALAGYEQFVTEYPESQYLDDARYGIELSLLHLGHYHNPVEATQAFLNKYPTSRLAPDLNYWIAQYQQQNHLFKEAEEEYKKIISTFPNDEASNRARVALGILLRDQDRLVEALEQFNAAANSHSSDPSVAEALYQAADVYIKLNEVSEAISCLNLASHNYLQSPYASRSQLRLGSLYSQLGLKSEAQVTFNDLIDHFPGSPEADYAWLYIGLVLLEGGKYLDSIGYFDHASNSFNQDVAAAALYNKALALQFLGKDEDAGRTMTELASRFPSMQHKYSGEGK